YGRRVAKKIILDCDPGIDDALAITFAVGSPDLDLIGITSVAGNVGLDLTTSNAQRVCEFIGAPGIPVTPGAAAPLLRAPIDARLVHGDSGLGGARLPDPRTPPAGGHAIDYIIDTIKAAPGEITLVATGPLTNVALAVHREPRLVSLVSDFVIMGGSASRGRVQHRRRPGGRGGGLPRGLDGDHGRAGRHPAGPGDGGGQGPAPAAGPAGQRAGAARAGPLRHQRRTDD